VSARHDKNAAANQARRIMQSPSVRLAQRA
jgi:hypothetical protein